MLRRLVVPLFALVVALTLADPAAAADPSFSGGRTIRHPAGSLVYICTAGFNAVTAGGHSVVITAGHCGRVGTDWHAASGRRIGTISARRYSTGADGDDYAVIRSNGNFRLRAQVVDRGVVKKVARLGKARRGMRVCMTGRTSGTRCGRITRVRRNGQIYAGFAVRNGDSGGPLFHRIPGTRKVAAIGITNDAGSGFSVYQNLREVLRERGLRLKTS